MKLVAALLLSVALISGLGCSYGAIAVNTADNTVIIARNDAFLFGALRKIYVCRYVDGRITDCSSQEAAP